MLRVESITKSFNRNDATPVTLLDNFSIEIDVGALASINAPRGSGKTTLCLIAGGLIAPDTGRVLLDAIDIHHLPKSKRRQFIADNMGFLFQRLNLIPSLSIFENIILPSLSHPEERLEPRARELAKSLGLKGKLDKRPQETNLDSRVKTALARALLRNPRLLIADEPTWNLSEETTDIVMTALKRHADSGHIVLTTHHGKRWHVAKCNRPR